MIFYLRWMRVIRGRKKLMRKEVRSVFFPIRMEKVAINFLKIFNSN